MVRTPPAVTPYPCMLQLTDVLFFSSTHGTERENCAIRRGFVAALVSTFPAVSTQLKFCWTFGDGKIFRDKRCNALKCFLVGAMFAK